MEEISVVRVQAMEDKAVLCCVVVENLEDDLTKNTQIYYPTLLRRVEITRETSTNITRYLYSSHSPDRANY